MKPQKRMHSSKVDVGLDRLSEMPDQVIVHILSCMTTRDAVKTMLLRRFGNLWTMLPALSFDFNDPYVSDKDGAYEEKQRIISEAFSRFARFVRNVLLLHRRSTIDSFYLDIGEYKSGLVDPYLEIDVDDRPFTLNCPHVEILKIAVDRRDETSQSNLLDVIDVSSLQDVFVKELPNGLSGPVTKAFLRHFRDVEVFTLSGDAFEQLCSVEKVDIPQNKWQGLALQPMWDNRKCLEVIIELMKSSVDLEELIVYGGESSRSEGNHGVISSELPTSCEMPLLKYVTIHGYGKYREGQLQLVEFVLRNAVILEKLVIRCDENQLTAVEELKFLKQVLRFKKASKNVIVEFA